MGSPLIGAPQQDPIDIIDELIARHAGQFPRTPPFIGSQPAPAPQPSTTAPGRIGAPALAPPATHQPSMIGAAPPAVPADPALEAANKQFGDWQASEPKAPVRADIKTPLWRKLLGVGEAGLVGYTSRDPQAGMQIGRGIIDKPFNTAEDAYKQQEADWQNRGKALIDTQRVMNPPEVAAVRAQAGAQQTAAKAAAGEQARQEQNDWKMAAQKEHEQFMADMEQKRQAATPYQEWAANPQVYDAYLKAQAAAKQSGRGSIMSPYAAVKLADYAYMYDPRLLPFAQAAMKSVAQQIGMQLPPGLDISTPPAGQPVDEQGNALGLRQPGAPTGATRSRGQFAEAVIPSIDDAKQQISKLGDQVGPVAGRWNELYKSKLGAFGPQYTGLQTSLKNIGTAWMRLHANSEKAREDFEASLKTAQDPANLIANLEAIDKQAQDYVAAGKGRPNQLSGKTSKPATSPKPETAPKVGPPQGVSVPQGWKWQQQDGKWGITDGKSFRPYSGQ